MHDELKRKLKRLERDLGVFVARFLEIQDDLDEPATRTPSHPAVDEPLRGYA